MCKFTKKCASFWKKSGRREVLEILIVWFCWCCCARKYLRCVAPVEEAATWGRTVDEVHYKSAIGASGICGLFLHSSSLLEHCVLAFFQESFLGGIYCYANFFCYANFSIVFGSNFRGQSLWEGQTASGGRGRKLVFVFQGLTRRPD